MAKARAPTVNEPKALFSSTVLARVRELIVTGEIPAGSHLAAEPIASRLSCPLLSGPSTMTVWIEEGTTNASEEAQARGDHRQAA